MVGQASAARLSGARPPFVGRKAQLVAQAAGPLRAHGIIRRMPTPTLAMTPTRPACTRRIRFPLMAPLLAALGLATALGAQAQTFKDPALEALFTAERIDELQRVSAARLSAQADDAQAVLGVALAALERDDAPARLAAIKRAEACIDKQPKAAPCHYALGATMGVQAMSEGMFKMARSLGTVKDALNQAHALEPDWYLARSALIEFNLVAPGMMGGSASKAAELARSAARPGQVKALEARVALQDKKFDEALQALQSLPAGTEGAVLSDARSWTFQAGMGLVNSGQAVKAQAHFERLTRERADTAAPFYGLARARGEQGAHEDALKLYEQAQKLKGASQWPLQYRIGMSLQQLGRKDEAKASYKKYVALGKGPSSLLSDAKKRLEELGG
jgi:tetratricopeptide (TPR) repeat protein